LRASLSCWFAIVTKRNVDWVIGCAGRIFRYNRQPDGKDRTAFVVALPVCRSLMKKYFFVESASAARRQYFDTGFETRNARRGWPRI
jgi:hypothetical protein